MEEFDGDHAVERRHGDGHPRLDYSHLTSVLWGVRKGFQARLDELEAWQAQRGPKNK